jgi:hypothetical protein
VRERKTKEKSDDGIRVRLWARPMVWAFRMFIGRPRDSALALVCAVAICAIVINGLYLQPGPHPAPIFVLRQSPVLLDEPLVAMLPKPRPPDAPQPEQRAETKSRIEPVTQAKMLPAAGPQRAAKPDPIGELLTGGNQITSIQRALSEFGYGPVAATGNYGPETRAAIERFERDRKLPVTGQVSERLVRELSQLVGKPI